MDFKVKILNKKEIEFTHETFPELMDTISREIAQWNAYDPKNALSFIVYKVKGQTGTIGIKTSDETTAQEKIS